MSGSWDAVRVGYGFDVHRFAAGRPLILGGLRLHHDQGLDGHSDADVLTHAVIDALLGAAGLGDIGRWFPDTDPRYRDADSLGLLEQVWRRLAGDGWRVVNVDATVVAEAPKLAPHAPAMARNLAGVLGVDPSHQHQGLHLRGPGFHRPRGGHRRAGRVPAGPRARRLNPTRFRTPPNLSRWVT